MSYRVLIPTAGIGSRLDQLTRYLNKSLVTIANRPTLSHIIDLFPTDAEFVIALGHKGNLVREFLTLAYPARTFFYSYVSPYEGPKSGLGLSILACKEHLLQPFIFISCDTLVCEKIPPPDHNWMGYADISNTDQYRTITINGESVLSINEKKSVTGLSHKAYIGLAGINEYSIFWEAMQNGGENSIRTGEVYGLRQILSSGITGYKFTWYDTGNHSALKNTRDAFRLPNEPNILEKPDEAIWFVEDNVIKFSENKQFIANRVARATKIKEFIPSVTGSTEHLYRYKKAEGIVLSDVVTLPLFKKFLHHSLTFWQTQALNEQQQSEFRNNCLVFYKDKTIDRVNQFYLRFGKLDGNEEINGKRVTTLIELFDQLDWNWLSDGLAGRFHGDFHFENILYSQSTDSFKFLDWRQDFGGSLITGDIYYDLAKLLHGLIISHEIIADKHFTINWTANEITYDFHRKQKLVDCEQYFYFWLVDHGFDVKKVRLLTAIVYLNIAALHHHPYCELLYALGKSLLFDTFQQSSKSSEI